MNSREKVFCSFFTPAIANSPYDNNMLVLWLTQSVSMVALLSEPQWKQQTFWLFLQLRPSVNEYSGELVTSWLCM
jgi:hypothetical protein